MVSNPNRTPVNPDSPRITPRYFFSLVFLLSVPFWFLGALVSTEFLPALPVSASMAICPALAGIFLTWHADGVGAVRVFIRKAIDFLGMRLWVWLAALATMPLVTVLSVTFLTTLGESLPPPVFDLSQTMAIFALSLVAAIAEELGWTGYITAPLVRSHGMIVAALVIGGVSAIWHVIPLLQADRSWDWIVWWAIGSMGRRVLMVWLFVKGGQRVFATSLFHAMSNVSWMLFPVMGSHYDPVSMAIILIGLSVLIVTSCGNTRDIELPREH